MIGMQLETGNRSFGIPGRGEGGVNDGKGPCDNAQEYGDIELMLECKTVALLIAASLQGSLKSNLGYDESGR